MKVLCLLPLLAAVAQAGNIYEELKDLGTFGVLLNFTDTVGQTDFFTNGGPFTIFAFTDKSFAESQKNEKDKTPPTPEELKKIVLYHAVPGKIFSRDLQNDITVNSVEGIPIRVNIYNTTVTINGATVETADIEASNGVIHVVSRPLNPIPTASIAGLVSSDPRFSTLLAAVAAAGLVDTLSGKGPFTVFAPTNEAFSKIPKDTLDGLLANKDALTKVLLRHVVPGTIFEEGIADKQERFTAGGSTPADVITFNVSEDPEKESSEEESSETSEEEDDEIIKVKTVSGSAKVIDTDIIALNGVIHVIDTVV